MISADDCIFKLNDGGVKTITNSVAAGSGGFVYTSCVDDVDFLLDNASISTSTSTTGAGGLLWTNAVGRGTYQLTNGYANTVTSDTGGGLIYAPDTVQELDLDVNTFPVTNSHCSGASCKGGGFELGAHTGTSTLNIIDSDFTNVYSGARGSIVSLEGSSSMDLTAVISGSEFYGGTEIERGIMINNNDNWDDIVEDLLTITRGNAMYFGSTGTSTITSSNSKF